MAIVIGSNIRGQQLTRLLDSASAAAKSATTRLSSGQRINKASDDAAGLAVSTSLHANSRVYGQAIRNANDGISFLSVASTALEQLNLITQRQTELAQQSANGILGLAQRRALNEEAKQLTEEYNRIIASTQYNSRNVFSLTEAGSLVIQTGAAQTDCLNIQVGQALSTSVDPH